MLVVKSKSRKHKKYVVGGGLASIPPESHIAKQCTSGTTQNTSTCCNSGASTKAHSEISTIPVSNEVARKALTEKSKEFLHELKKKQD